MHAICCFSDIRFCCGADGNAQFLAISALVTAMAMLAVSSCHDWQAALAYPAAGDSTMDTLQVPPHMDPDSCSNWLYHVQKCA